MPVYPVGGTPFARTIDAANKYVVSSTFAFEVGVPQEILSDIHAEV
ncbi:MAG TPA: hypothetical protein VMH88_14285 [Gemmatimonadales bacterium]|nr:hypothetical protein [Gemmatimonadales bacterium]